ncbi:inorganic phosphate transporter [Kurthia massiliensis]|uniref:inorganic phosphate transporter n=1 Tax=Kurthia massiliensis TaxID=1033739 RepID=UPI000289F665|nr:inorganic phosphate transporter [Kurthia massiliensis]
MDSVIIITVLVVFFALAFDFINGFHDTANAIATAVSTRALPPRVAVIMAALMNFIGAITFTGVAQALAKDIVDPFALENGVVIILASLISAIIWNLATWYFGIPSSSSHALIGSLAGAAAMSAGFGVINWEGFTKIIKALILSPFIAIVIGFLMMTLFRVLFSSLSLYKTNNRFRKLQILTAAVQSFTHGTNDAQKSMGIITMALMAGGLLAQGSEVPFWVRISCAIAMGLGTSVGGYKIIKTVGSKIMKIRPVNGVAADMSSALIIFGATQLHLPVSTTHVISSAIMGVGAAQNAKGVKWGVARNIVITWVITLPLAGLMGGCIFWLLNLFL